MYRRAVILLLLGSTAACTSVGRDSKLTNSICSDFHNFYNHQNIRSAALVFGTASALEQSSADAQIRSWYEADLEGSDADKIASPGNFFANDAIMLPIAAGAFTFEFFSGGQATTAVGQWGERSLRAFAVGGPVIVASREVFGVSFGHERWSNGAFVSAVPFATAAAMTDRWLLKGMYYAGSTYGAWSSFNNGRQEFSATIAGWWLAFRAAASVGRSETDSSHWEIVPILKRNFSGLGLMLRF